MNLVGSSNMAQIYNRSSTKDVVSVSSVGSGSPFSTNYVSFMVDQLSTLEDNWDSYGGHKPTPQALTGAVRWAYELFVENTPVPDVFPLANGNIQIEWSQSGLDIEIEVTSISTCNLVAEDYRSELEEVNGKTFVYQIKELVEWVDVLSARSGELAVQ